MTVPFDPQLATTEAPAFSTLSAISTERVVRDKTVVLRHNLTKVNDACARHVREKRRLRAQRDYLARILYQRLNPGADPSISTHKILRELNRLFGDLDER